MAVTPLEESLYNCSFQKDRLDQARERYAAFMSDTGIWLTYALGETYSVARR